MIFYTKWVLWDFITRSIPDPIYLKLISQSILLAPSGACLETLALVLLPALPCIVGRAAMACVFLHRVREVREW